MSRPMTWAAKATPKNYQAILSEAALRFDLDFLEKWVAANGDGYFLRDATSILDCHLIPAETFEKAYIFVHNDPDNLFRQVVAKGQQNMF